MRNDLEFFETIITTMNFSQQFTPTSIPQPSSSNSKITVIAIFALIGVLIIAGVVSYLYCKCYNKKINRQIQPQLPEPFTTAHQIRKDNNNNIYYENENPGIENNIEDQASMEDINMGSVNEDRVSQDSELSINSDIEPMLKKTSSTKISDSMPRNLIASIFRTHSTTSSFQYRAETSDGSINPNPVEKADSSAKQSRHSSAKQSGHSSAMHSRHNSVLD